VRRCGGRSEQARAAGLAARAASPGGGGGYNLDSVSCVTAKECTAVGTYQVSGVQHALAEYWNGTSWSAQTTASPASDKEIFGVSCTSAHACTAVGVNDTSVNVNDTPLAERQ
jgi:hypothetical protein